MTNIAFGQYYPAHSPLHRLDARMKVILAILYIVCTFLCKNIWSFVAIAGSALLLTLLSHVPMRVILRALKPIILLMVFTAVINLFWTGGQTLLFQFWRIHIYAEGLYRAAFMVVRMVVLILGSGLFLTYTTTPIALTDAIESLLSPLRVIHVPVHEFAMMMSIALRFIPTLMEETEKIMNAQKARGVDFSSGGLFKRAKALIPILIPLMVSSFRRADELAMAMECRCYRGGKGRTKLNVPQLHARDFIALLLMVSFAVGLILLNRYGTGFSL